MSFVAVPAHAGRVEVDPVLERSGPQDAAAALSRAAAQSVAEVRSVVCAVPGAAILALLVADALGAAPWSEWDVLSAIALAAAGTTFVPGWGAPGSRHGLASRGSGRHWAVAAPVLYALVAVRAGVAPPVVSPGELTVLAVVVVFTGVLGAAALAPRLPWALAAAAVPLPGLLVVVFQGLEPSALGTGTASGLLAGTLAVFLHKRWRQATLRAFENADQLARMAASRDAAVRADREKSRFLAIASHDLRQPVHAIGLFAATLDKRLRGTPEEMLVRNLNRSIEGLDQSFNVMLDISRLDAGAIEPRVQHFPVRDLFRRLHMHFAGQAEQKGLSLRLSPGGKSVSSDPQLLERILGNLVQNAIKYTDRGGVVVVARSTATHLSIEVWDSGIGIAADDLRRVFDEFFQVGRGERARAQGLGMGLAIVKRLVSLLGHELTVSSRPGRGTMFRLRVVLGGLPEIQDVTAAADTLPMPVLQARTILVLDDEEAIREGLCLLLQEWGYEAVLAGSIGEALRATADLQASPDLILSDLHLGDGPDGIAAIEAVRRQCGHDVAAMLITGDTTTAEIRRATESGHVLLFKPLQPRKLYDALRGVWT